MITHLKFRRRILLTYQGNTNFTLSIASPSKVVRAKLLSYYLVGGGGSGGNGNGAFTITDPCGGSSTTYRGAGGGGGGHGYIASATPNLVLNMAKTYSITVGAGGNNSAGGATIFKEDSTNLYTANGGNRGGDAGFSIAGNFGGAGGTGQVNGSNGQNGVIGSATTCIVSANGGAGGSYDETEYLGSNTAGQGGKGGNGLACVGGVDPGLVGNSGAYRIVIEVIYK